MRLTSCGKFVITRVPAPHSQMERCSDRSRPCQTGTPRPASLEVALTRLLKVSSPTRPKPFGQAEADMGSSIGWIHLSADGITGRRRRGGLMNPCVKRSSGGPLGASEVRGDTMPRIGAFLRFRSFALVVLFAALLASCSDPDSASTKNSLDAQSAGQSTTIRANEPTSTTADSSGSTSTTDDELTETSVTFNSDEKPSPSVTSGGDRNPCGLLTIDDVRAVLPGAAQGIDSGTGSCFFNANSDNIVTVNMMQVLRKEMADDIANKSRPDSGWTKLDGLGDIGYRSIERVGPQKLTTQITVEFYKGDTGVGIYFKGGEANDLEAVVSLAKEAAVALRP